MLGCIRELELDPLSMYVKCFRKVLYSLLPPMHHHFQTLSCFEIRGQAWVGLSTCGRSVHLKLKKITSLDVAISNLLKRVKSSFTNLLQEVSFTNL